MNYDDYSFCAPLLEPGEMICWKGKPQKGNLFRKDEKPVIVVLVGAACFALIRSIPFLAPLRIDIINTAGYICSVLSVLYLLLKFTVRPYLRKRSLYVITNRKVIAKQGKKIRTMDLSDPLPIYEEYYRDGKGTISFGARGFLPINPRGSGAPRSPRKGDEYAALTGSLALENIPDAERVYDMVCDINYALNFGEEE